MKAILAAAVAAVTLFAFAPSSEANGRVSIGFSVGSGGYCPPPVYHHYSPPVYYHRPAPRYYHRPVYRPAYRPVYYDRPVYRCQPYYGY
ncbi:hypothetical protein BH23VER1_BH23VER1_07030 [soil metagenome]